MAKEIFEFIKKDGTRLKGIAWNTNKKINASVIIITGMAEKAERYDDFANFLNSHSYNVYCLEHYGHGLNTITENDLGIWNKSDFRRTVISNHELVRKLKITCAPIYILGHSMGSFILQDFIQRFGREVDKVILCGSNGPSLKTKLGGILSRQIARFKGRHYRSKFVHEMVFKGYNKQFPNRTEFDWLSTDNAVVDAYVADPYCGFMPTVGFYAELARGMNRLFKKDFLRKIPAHLPILIISGKHDPVSNNGKGIHKLEKKYQKYNLTVKTIIYENMRHEILNEIDKQTVYNDILTFLESK